jgi:cellobiose epimerase
MLEPHQVRPSAKAYAKQLETQLRALGLPWWAQTVDRENGGYRLAPDEKQLATQSRMAWVFSHAHRRGFGDYLGLAEHGISFLLGRFHDSRHGGFFWKTDLKGRLRSDRKILYGQLFAAYAFVEYVRAGGDRSALDEARSLFELLAERAHDDVNGGWIEHFKRNWRPLLRHRRGLEVEIPGLKSANTHLHAVEACTAVYAEVGGRTAEDLLTETIDVTTAHFFPDDPRASASHCTPDWSPTGGAGSPGHRSEFAWLLVEAEQALGREPDWTRFDAYLGDVLGEARTQRLWWEEAEILAALAIGFRRDPSRYEQSFAELLAFLVARAIDPADGVWVYTVSVDGSPGGTTRISTWKDAFHEVRATALVAEAAEGEGGAVNYRSAIP